MPATYIQIGTAQVAGAGGSASFTFTAIPNTYTDLILKASITSTGGTNWALLTINGTANNTIDLLHIIGDANTVASQAYDSGRVTSNRQNDAGTTQFANATLYIPNYTAGIQKSMSSESGQSWSAAPRPSMSIAVQRWNNTGAITSLTLAPDGGGTFLQHSSAYLYGVSNA
jgi:hypothetical protein